MNDKVISIILAAGKGTRMNSKVPKVLHKVGGRTILDRVLTTAQKCSDEILIVTGYGAEKVESSVLEKHENIKFVHQKEQLGTGNAVKTAIDYYLSNNVGHNKKILILYGDVPFIKKETIKELLQLSEVYSLSLLTANIEKPKGYGRIIRDNFGNIKKIVEEKDANKEERKINEVNSGIMSASLSNMNAWLENIDNNNSQGEYYLTDVIAGCVKQGESINAICIDNLYEIEGINSQSQKARLERIYQQKMVDSLTDKGLSVADHKRLEIRGKLTFKLDTFIDINVIIEGDVNLGEDVTIGSHCYLKDCTIGDNTEVKPYTHIEGSIIAENCIIGPYARIRPESTLANGVHIGNFVEIKKTEIASQSKVNHLSYLGDAVIGSKTNIGAGTITCNYDGKNKHKTIIGDEVFIGSGTELVAPIIIGNGATVGAGTTADKDISEHSLGLGRTKQIEVKNWISPRNRFSKTN